MSRPSPTSRLRLRSRGGVGQLQDDLASLKAQYRAALQETSRPQPAGPSALFCQLAEDDVPAQAAFVRAPRRQAPAHRVASSRAAAVCGW
eukprot:13326662-Alexandrium_andersonii.AAC.1